MASPADFSMTRLLTSELRDRVAHWRFLAERGLPDRVAREVAALASELEVEAAQLQPPAELPHS
jgi:hypothetical protein